MILCCIHPVVHTCTQSNNSNFYETINSKELQEIKSFLYMFMLGFCLSSN